MAALVGIDRNFTGRRQRRGTACGFEDWGLDVSRKITRIARIGFDGARPLWVGKKLRFSWSTRRPLGIVNTGTMRNVNVNRFVFTPFPGEEDCGCLA